MKCLSTFAKGFLEYPMSFYDVDASDIKGTVSGEFKLSHMQAQSSENYMKAWFCIFPFKDIVCRRQRSSRSNVIKKTQTI